MARKQINLPYLQVYLTETQVLLTDLTNAEVGIYFKLLLRCCEAGYLPNNIKTLRVIARVSKQLDGSIQKVMDTCFVWNDEYECFTSPAVDVTYQAAKRTTPYPENNSQQGKANSSMKSMVEVHREEKSREEKTRETPPNIGVTREKEYVARGLTGIRAIVENVYGIVESGGVLSEKQQTYFDKYHDCRVKKPEEVVYFPSRAELLTTPQPNEHSSVFKPNHGWFWDSNY